MEYTKRDGRIRDVHMVGGGTVKRKCLVHV